MSGQFKESLTHNTHRTAQQQSKAMRVSAIPANASNPLLSHTAGTQRHRVWLRQYKTRESAQFKGISAPATSQHQQTMQKKATCAPKTHTAQTNARKGSDHFCPSRTVLGPSIVVCSTAAHVCPQHALGVVVGNSRGCSATTGKACCSSLAGADGKGSCQHEAALKHGASPTDHNRIARA